MDGGELSPTRRDESISGTPRRRRRRRREACARTSQAVEVSHWMRLAHGFESRSQALQLLSQERRVQCDGVFHLRNVNTSGLALRHIGTRWKMTSIYLKRDARRDANRPEVALCRWQEKHRTSQYTGQWALRQVSHASQGVTHQA